jgi:hypothetical protein
MLHSTNKPVLFGEDIKPRKNQDPEVNGTSVVLAANTILVSMLVSSML